ncbi:hypothetical protein ACSBR2_039663 [Camellia fascicularis]
MLKYEYEGSITFRKLSCRLNCITCVNNNGDPLAPGDVTSSVVPRVAHTADRSGEYGVNVARTVLRVSTATSRTMTSNFAKASYAIGLADSGSAILLADTIGKQQPPFWQRLTLLLVQLECL